MQVDGVLHEFSSIPGVREDVTDVVLNVKAIALRMGGDGPKRMRLRAEGPGAATAGQIEKGRDIETMIPSLVLVLLAVGAREDLETERQPGRGMQTRMVGGKREYRGV